MWQSFFWIIEFLWGIWQNFPQKQGNIQQISFCEQTSHRRKRLIGSALKQKKNLKMDLNVWWKRRKSKRMPELASLWWAPTGFPFKASIMYCAYGDRRGGCQQSRKLSLATCQTLRLWYFGEDLKCERILSQNAKKESKIEAFVISSVAVVSIKCYSRPLFFDCCFRL